jgi:hypothetical protein
LPPFDFWSFLKNLGSSFDKLYVCLVLFEDFDRNLIFIVAHRVDADDIALWLYLSFFIWNLVALLSIVRQPLYTFYEVIILALQAIVPGFSLLFCGFVLGKLNEKNITRRQLKMAVKTDVKVNNI